MGTGANTMSQNDAAGRVNDERTASDPTPNEQVNDIQADIAQTRAEMSETITELQERLSPAHLKEQLKDQVREQYEHAKQTVRGATIGKVEDMVERVSDSVYETRRTIVDTISANPVPSALIGIGLAWLWMNARSESQASGGRYGQRSRSGGAYHDREYDYDYGTTGTYPSRGASGGRREDTAATGHGGGSGTSWTRTAADAVSGGASRLQETASSLAGRAKETVSGAVGQAQATAGEWLGQAQHQAQRVEERLQVTMQESPLGIGAVAFALGTAIGLAVPPTRKENEWMGETRDRLLDRAQSVAHDTMEQVQDVAQKVTTEMAGSGKSRSQEGEGAV
jgi:hypothetical protein